MLPLCVGTTVLPVVPMLVALNVIHEPCVVRMKQVTMMMMVVVVVV
jgi:hypothetical protein